MRTKTMGVVKEAKRLPIERWRVPRAEIEEELRTGKKPEELVCLGCAAKVELVSTVYPVLHELKNYLTKNTRLKLQPRDDVYLFETDGEVELHRGKYAVKDILEGRTAPVTQDVQKYQPDGIVMLANFLPFPSQEKLKKTLLGYYDAAAKAGKTFVVGKGHTIQIAKCEGEEYVAVEYLRTRGARYYGVANNDTISTIDPNLVYASWISVFVALNNAIADVFLSGVYKNIKVYPTFDARDPEDVPRIREALRRYQEHFSEMDIEIVEQPSLGFGTKSMGATVIGLTDREVPINQRLAPGQILLSTRPVGDLAPLTAILIKQSLEEDVSEWQNLRFHVLNQMLTPNIEAAKIIARHLPFKGEPFDVEKHITVCRDMTGPGMLAVEELAQDSAMDIYVDDIKLHDERIAEVEMPNPTSGTNGAIIMAAMPKLAEKVYGDLKAVGYDPWVIGRVEKKANAKPQIILNERLKCYPFVRGIQKGIFENYTFTAPRALPTFATS